MNSIIQINNLNVSFAKKQILKNVSLIANRGEKLYIVGPNGAGKTTLLKTICKIIADYSGQITIENKNLKKYRQKQLAKILTYLPQNLGSNIEFTAEQFITMARYPHLSPFSIVSPKDRQIVRDAMGMTETEEFAHRKMNSLSGGERQQISVAAALAQQAKIFLLDEPTTYLDYKHQSHIQKILHRINKNFNTTIICVTHDLNSAALNADKIIAIKQGNIVFNGSCDEIMNEDVLKEIYDKDFELITMPKDGKKIIAPE